jgi:hypothetical protein
VDFNTEIEVVFGRDATKREFSGVLIYKLRRNGNLGSNADNIFTEEPSTSVQLLVIWEHKGWYGFPAHALLIEHSNTITWNEDKLKELYSMRHALVNKIHYITVPEDHCSISDDVWLVNDTKIMMTKTTQDMDNYMFGITLSEWTDKNPSKILYEEIRNGDYTKPLWIPSSM